MSGNPVLRKHEAQRWEANLHNHWHGRFETYLLHYQDDIIWVTIWLFYLNHIMQGSTVQ